MNEHRGPKRRSYGFVGAEKHRSTPPQPARTFRRTAIEHLPPKKNPAAAFFLCSLLTIIKFPFLCLWFLIRLPHTLYAMRRHPKKGDQRLWFRRLALAGLTLTVLGLVSGTALVAWVSRDLPNPDKLTDREIAQTTKIYDRTGTHLLYEIFVDQKRTLIELDQVPKNLINGLVATEDKLFYEHRGVRPLSVLRSIVYSLLGKTNRLGGGSTITQQLVKNAILTNERSLTRKIKEVVLSLRLEQKYTKEQILKIYFNEIPYGSTNYGVEAAAQSYFGKHAAQLDLQESATLAGLPQAPTTYLNDQEALKRRRNLVLDRMIVEHYINKEAGEAAKASPLTLKERFTNSIEAPHFVQYVRQQLVEQFGEHAVVTRGLKVVTTLDFDKQKFAEAAVAAASSTFTKAGANNVALVALDPKTGQIISLIGSRDFFDEKINGQYNVAIQGRRQPGSSIKPIFYAAAFAKGYTPETILFDVKTNFAVSGRPFSPGDYDLKERGPVTVRQALQGSLNIPAVEMFYLVGLERGITFAEQLGYTTFAGADADLSMALGSREVSMLEHVSAYGVFANSGVRHAPASILSVDDAKGTRLFEWHLDAGTSAIDPTISATISNVLSDDGARAYIFGANSVLTLKDRPVAVKTGTSQEFRDAWTVGYTPSLVTAVWAGNTDRSPMRVGFEGYRVVGGVWNQFMNFAHKGTPVELFPAPPASDTYKPILRGAVGGAMTVSINRTTGKLAASSTPPSAIEIKTYLPAHTILHYIDKNDPRGAVPEHPETDAQYPIWEAAYQDWIARTASSTKSPRYFGEPPSTVDDPQTLELLPEITVLSPTPSSTLTSRQIQAMVQVSAPRGVTRVTYQIDNFRTISVLDAPFTLDYYASGLPDGNHVLTVSAIDDIGNQKIQFVPFILHAGIELPGVYFGDHSQTMGAPSFPHPFFLSTVLLPQIKSVTISKQSPDGSGRMTLETITDFSRLIDNKLLFVWNDHPTTGTWVLSADVTLADGSTRETSRMIVTVE